MSNRSSAISQENGALVYDSPHAVLHDITRGNIPVDAMRMDQWIQCVSMAMIDDKQTELVVEVPYGGGLYQFHHSIKLIKPPAKTGAVLRTMQ